MEHIVVVGWERFQHYKDRDPPWVKLYRDLLTSESWVLGTDISRLVQVASILLAARYTNKIPLQWTLIRKVSSLECSEKQFREALQHLQATKFIEIQQDSESASNTLAICTTSSEVLYSETEQSRAEQRQSKRASAPVELHESLPKEEWGIWIEHRREKRWPLDPRTLRVQLDTLAKHDTATQADMILRSINGGWQGIFPPRGQEQPKRRWRPTDDEPVGEAH